MEQSAGIAFLDHVLATQRQMYRVQLCLAVGLVMFGAGLIALGSLLAGVVIADYWKWLLTLGGTFAASLSSMRVSDIYGAKARLGALVQLRADFQHASAVGGGESAELTRLKERVEKLYDKTLGL